MIWCSVCTLFPFRKTELSRADRRLTTLTRSSAVLSVAVLLMVMVFLVVESYPAVREFGLVRFVTDDGWHPLSGQFNILPMMAATVLTSLAALLISAPLGIATAAFVEFYIAPGWARWSRHLIELLAGIPSVVYGLWGLVALAPLIARLGGSGQCLLTATLVLGLMILPTVALTAMAAFRAVPQEILLAASALGLERGSIVRCVAVPAARRGIVTGVLLALSRGVGETMAVLMVAGNVVAMPESLLSPVRTLTANIALELGYATAAHRSILFVSGLALMIIIVALVLVMEFVGGIRDA